MSDQKYHQFRSSLHHDYANIGERASGATRATSSAATSERRSDEQQGSEAYRKWVSRETPQPVQRSPLNASIYSWQGYNNWADKVRQTWKADDPVDS